MCRRACVKAQSNQRLRWSHIQTMVIEKCSGYKTFSMRNSAKHEMSTIIGKLKKAVK